MISFHNPGVLDLTAATTFGVSVKEGANPIGFFGTGFKYALAITLRSGGKIVLWRGLERHEFSIQKHTVRGVEFEMVCLDDKPMGFTTRLGVNWQLWQAFREFYCNALDEGGNVVEGAREPQPETTTLQVTGLEAPFRERDEIVLPATLPVRAETDQLRVLPSPGRHIYYRGVRVQDLPKPALFTYNILAHQDLTEDRTLATTYKAVMVIARFAREHADERLLFEMMTAPVDTFEHEMDLDWGSLGVGETFLEVMGRVRKNPALTANLSALRVYTQHRHDPVEHKTVALNNVEVIQLARAIRFLHQLGCKADEYPIKVVETLGDGVHGQAVTNEGVILLAKRCFELGTKYVASTLYEEYIHLARGYGDCTRELQSYLFDQVISLAERLQGEPL